MVEQFASESWPQLISYEDLPAITTETQSPSMSPRLPCQACLVVMVAVPCIRVKWKCCGFCWGSWHQRLRVESNDAGADDHSTSLAPLFPWSAFALASSIK